MSLYASPLREVSQFTTALWILWIWALLVFIARCFGNLSLSLADSRDWGTWCGAQTLHSSRSSSLWYSLVVGCHAGLRFFWRDGISAFPTSLGVALLPSVVKGPVSWFSEGIVLYVVVDSMCTWEEMSSGSSYATILDCLGVHTFKELLNPS